MNILVVDLEATCSDDNTITRADAEIIEIGAVLVSGGAIVDEYCRFVRPTVNSVLHPFCTQLTTIQQSDVDAAEPFLRAYPDFLCWLAGRSGRSDCFASWGRWDGDQVWKECRANNLHYPFGKHVDIAGEAKKVFGIGSKFRVLRHLGIPWEGTVHRGIDDARNHAKIVVAMLEKGWRPPTRKDSVP